MPRSSSKHDDHGAPPPSSEIMPKHDEDMGGISKKNVGRQLGLVRIYLTQRSIKIHENSLQNLLVRSQRARQQPVE